MGDTSLSMTLAELYRLHGQSGTAGERARALLEQAHWYSVNAIFDPKTSHALPQPLTSYLARVGREATDSCTRDRLWRITEHARAHVERLARDLNESPRREHALLPVRAVRELDANSFIKLSSRPGRTIRQKLAGKPYLQAVRRYQSIDLPENRLFKAFVSRLAELLRLRTDWLAEAEDALLPIIASWLRSDEARSISKWENLPPNNALLSHRDYRRIWDAWRWLTTLDHDVSNDWLQLEQRRETVKRWNGYAQMYRDGGYRFAEMPVLFDYEGFRVLPWCTEPILKRAIPPVERAFAAEPINEPACIDLAIPVPRYASATRTAEPLRPLLVWQRWQRESELVEIELFNSDAIFLHPDAISIAASDLFFATRSEPDQLDGAARAFAKQLRITFQHDALAWLVPDWLSDFDVEVIRRNLNAIFPSAEPVPRSVAAVFRAVDYKDIKRSGFTVAVVDGCGGKVCVTKLIARHDPDLEETVPETRGFYWERCPPVVIAEPEVASGTAAGVGYLTVDSDARWHPVAHPKRPPPTDPLSLSRDSRIGQCALVVNVDDSPVEGGVQLYALQERAGRIPLWRDQIPELAIKVKRNGRYERFSLVSRGTTVTPIRGRTIAIPVEEHFILPAGKSHYQFPLFQGENADELGFSARLDSLQFPLKASVECSLSLTFEYGADEPYKLVFKPLDASVAPVRATWRHTEEAVVMDAPAPAYPDELSWSQLRHVPAKDHEGTRNLLEWVMDGIDRIDRTMSWTCTERTTGEITHPWKLDARGMHFTFARCSNNRQVFLHEREFAGGNSFAQYGIGDEVSCHMRDGHRGLQGVNIAAADCQTWPESLAKTIRKTLYFPIIRVWQDGRSISDPTCPAGFAEGMPQRIKRLASLAMNEEVPKLVRDELMFLIACMHKDMPGDFVERLHDEVHGNRIRDPQAIGFALGDVSQGWQREVLSSLLAHPRDDVLRVLAFAIWRDRRVVDRLSLPNLHTVLQTLDAVLGELSRRRSRCLDAVQPLELLLGLLRTRASHDQEIHVLLQPHQTITKELAAHVERVAELFVQSGTTLFSRVQISLQRPEGDHTPDLIYALRLYLAGDDGAHAIHIAGVDDGE